MKISNKQKWINDERDKKWNLNDDVVKPRTNIANDIIERGKNIPRETKRKGY